MPRPTTKTELLTLGKTNFNKLLDFINALPNELKNKTYYNNEINQRDKTISDVICHLHEGHLMMMKGYEVGMSGEKPHIPAEGYTGKTLPLLNAQINEKGKNTPLEQAFILIKDSYQKLRDIIENHSEEELGEKKKYKGTGTTSLGAYFVSATSSHYDWGMKCLKGVKNLYITSLRDIG